MPKTQDHAPVLHTRKHLARLDRERRQTRLILGIFVGILAVVLTLLLYGYLDQRYLQLRRPVARVGAVEIAAAPFEARVRLQRRQLLSNYSQYYQYQQFGLDVGSQLQQIEASLNDPVSIGETVLQQMIDEEIIRQEAQRRGLSVTTAEVDAFIQANYGFFPLGTPTATITPTAVVSPTPPESAFLIVTRTPTASPTLAATPSTDATPTPVLLLPPSTTPTSVTPAAPTPTPLPTATPLTEAGFRDLFSRTLVDFGELGLTESAYRSLAENVLLRQKLLEVIAADVSPAPEQVWARHILVDEEVIAAAVRDRLQKGEDFASVAAEVSKDPGSAAKGGDLGWFTRGVMVDAFEDVAFSMPHGEISAPVHSDFGWHIIQVIARQERPYSHQEYEQARATAFSNWLQAARTDYAVETFDFWKGRVPTEPNFSSVATEAAQAEQTAVAEENARIRATNTPSP